MELYEIRNKISDLKKELSYVESFLTKTCDVLYGLQEKLLDIEDKRLDDFLSETIVYTKYLNTLNINSLKTTECKR